MYNSILSLLSLSVIYTEQVKVPLPPLSPYFTVCWQWLCWVGISSTVQTLLVQGTPLDSTTGLHWSADCGASRYHSITSVFYWKLYCHRDCHATTMLCYVQEGEEVFEQFTFISRLEVLTFLPSFGKIVQEILHCRWWPSFYILTWTRSRWQIRWGGIKYFYRLPGLIQ